MLLSRSKRAQMIRVDQAGELGATRIYAGQRAILGDSSIGKTLAHMANQEEEHRQAFDALMVKEKVRPTALSPLWNIMGYALGAGSALLGKRAAMACTIAVEEVIESHYAEQLQDLEGMEGEHELRDLITRCRDDELDHRDQALDAGAECMPCYSLFTTLIKCASRGAIWLSKRI